MKKVLVLFFILIFTVSLFGCSNTRSIQSQKDSNIDTFSYQDDVSNFADGKPGVITDGFTNVKSSPAGTEEQAINIAKNEVTVNYDTISVAYDESQNIWKISFSAKDTLGGDQAVYIHTTGVTKRIVYGE